MLCWRALDDSNWGQILHKELFTGVVNQVKSRFICSSAYIQFDIKFKPVQWRPANRSVKNAGLRHFQIGFTFWRIWQESVCHLLNLTCRQCGLFPKPLKEKKLPRSQTSECLFKDDDALKITLPGTVAGWPTTSCSVCCASNSGKGRWTDGTETVSISHESVPSVGASWLLTLLYHTVCRFPEVIPEQVTLRRGYSLKLLSFQKVVWAALDFLPQTFLERHGARGWPPPLKITTLSDWLLWLQVTESPLQWYMDWNCSAVLVRLTERGEMSKLWSKDKLQWLAGWHDHLFKLWSFHRLLRFVEPWWWSGRR